MIPSALASALFGVASSLSWGGGDFIGGMASRRIPARQMVAMVNVVGVIIAAILGLLSGQPIPPASDLMWGLAAGFCGALALLSFYSALASGQMGTLAPVAGVVGGIIPVVYAALTEGFPQIHQIGGFGLAMVGVWFVSRTGGEFKIDRSLGLAMVAGIGFGLFFILIRQAQTDSLMWLITSSKASSALTMIVPMLVSRTPWTIDKGSLGLSALSGALDLGGNVFFLLAAETGRLDIAVVLSSLYPAITVVLASVILKEKVSRSQAGGIAAMLAALPLIVL